MAFGITPFLKEVNPVGTLSIGVCTTSILNGTRVISLPYMQRAACCSVGEKLKEKMGHKLMFGSHFSYEYGQL